MQELSKMNDHGDIWQEPELFDQAPPPAVVAVETTPETDYVTPHVAKTIEVGAILYASWGYDQTNIDFYYVTRTTKLSCWIVPMSNVMTDAVGWASEHVVAGEPQWFSGWCECRHPMSNHGEVLNMTGPNYPHCRGSYGDDCDCRELRPVPNKPKMHRIRRTTYGEFVTLSSYSSASLWEGGKLYASHYA